MKRNTQYIFSLVFIFSIGAANAQTINWASFSDNHKHILNANVGLEHVITYGVGYGYRFSTKPFPIVVNAEYSFPSGNNLFDDFKTKAGAQVRVIEFLNF